MDVLAAIRYTKLREVGVGQGMNSTVFLAHDPHLDREIAVKEIDQGSIHSSGWDAYHQEAQAMFAARCENVVPIHYACVTSTEICLAMPFYREGSLQDWIASGPAPLRQAYRVAHGVLSALSQVHVAGIIHFDLKPSNVLFSDSREAMIADFGQARLMDPSGIAAVPRLYKYGVPPEAFSGVGTIESDVYQAGLTLYRLFNGDPFFKDQIPRLRNPLRISIQKGRLPNRRKFMPHIPSRVRRVIRKALQVDPLNRFGTVLEMQDALGRAEFPLDWVTEVRPGGELRWVARREGQPDLEVALLRDHRRHWKVEVHTSSAEGGRRRKGVADMWVDDVPESEAHRHLRGVFPSLS